MAYGRGYETGDEGADIAFGMMRGVRAFGDMMQQGQRIEADRMALEDEKGINAAYEHIARKVGQTGDISVLDGDPLMNTRHGTMAAGKFLGQRAQNETSRLQMLKSMEAGDDHFYRNTFRPMAFAAQEAFQKGDIQRFGAIANELSAKSPLPYRIEPTQDGNFRVRFRSSADGGWVDTGQTMTPQEVMEQIGGIIGGEQKILAGADMRTRIVNPRYLAAAARYRMGTIRSNADALADPKQWIPLTKGGHTIWAVPQNRHDDYSAAPAYRIVDEGGKMSGMVPNLDTLLQQGWGRGDVKAQLAGRQRVGQGKSGASAGGYKLTQGDVSMLTKYATREDPDSGEKITDFSTVAFLQDFVQRTGRSVPAAIAAYEGNIKKAMSKGASREQAEQLTIAGMSGLMADRTGEMSQRMPQTNSSPLPNMQPEHNPLHPLQNKKIMQGILGAISNRNLPQSATSPTKSRNAGQLVTYPKNGGTQWAIIGNDGMPQDIAPEDARVYSEEVSATERQRFKKRPPRVTINDVLDELSSEELADWQTSGRLPSRYNQVR